MLLRDIPLTAPLLRDYFVILRKRIGVNLTEKTFRKYELARDRLYALVDK